MKIDDVVFTPATGVTDNAVATSVNKFDIILGKERKRPFAIIRIPAIIRDDQGNKQLTSCSLSVTEKEERTPPALAKTTATNSVLSSGNWYKIAVAGQGIYKLDYAFIKNKIGIDPAGIQPANIRLYGNGGVMLPESNAVPVPEDLTENAIVVVDGNDGSFNEGDYILFYANGPQGWTKDSINKVFYHQKNIYEDKSYYFLNFDSGPGLRVASQSNPPTGNTTVNSYNFYTAHDEDLVSVGRFGKTWWGEEFSPEPGKQSSRVFDINTGPILNNAYIRINFGSRANATGNLLTMTLNNQPLISYNFGGVGSGAEDNPIVSKSWDFNLPVTGNTAQVKIDYSPAVTSGKGYLNFIEINTRRPLEFFNGQTTFRDWNSVGTGNIATYEIANANGNLTVWDITTPLQPLKMNGSIAQGNTYRFSQDAAALHEFIAFDGSQFLAPEFVQKIDNQNLHGLPQTDYIIVTPKAFLEAANKLADFHRAHNNLRVTVAVTDAIYNEFSSGSQDIGGIRDFARMFYKRAGTDTTEMPRYLLLFGDASFDYKNRTANNTNFVPTYETSESVNIINGYCSDDYFSFLDDNEEIENWNIANTMDLGVGRIPVASPSAAMDVVNKIINYTNPSSLGPWRISTTIISDNEDSYTHFIDGEIMAATINSNSDLYNETKVYLSAIPTVSTPGGIRAPDANKAINDAVFKGTFLMNYNGHGSITTMAHERILTQDDFNNWKNADKLPVMVTATCDFSKYDDPAYVSAGEKLMIKPDGGCIALLTTTQLVYAHLNRPMNMQYLEAMFRRYEGEWPTLGDAFRYSKNATYSTPSTLNTLANYRKFVLLGDPALTPAFPRYNISTDAIQDGVTAAPADTLKALGKYQISGSVKDNSGQVIPSFNGRVYVTIYDKPRTVSTLETPQKTFNIQNNIIYKGKATVTNGLFSFNFIAPKDLNYDFGKGKISYYAENGITDAAGADTSLYVGGFSETPVVEDNPPIVKPFMNDSLFQNGGITGSNSLLYVQLFDETGINVSGNGIGHDLVAVLDDNIQAPYILNDYYETAPNDFSKGYVYFPTTGLADGRHTIRVKAWDMNNNSGEGTVDFEVYNGKIMQVQNLMNYPNPFRDYTRFVFEHNHPDEELQVQIRIFSTSGSLARTITKTFAPEGSRTNEIMWDGTDDNGAKLPTGVYVYKINIATAKGIQATAHQKLVLIR